MEDLKARALRGCVACGACLDDCPVFPSLRYRDYGSGRLVESILALLRGEPATPEAADTLSSCMGCGRCAQWCPTDVAPAIFTAGRRILNSRGQSSPLLRLWKPDNPYSFAAVLSSLQMKPGEKRWHSTVTVPPRKVKTVLFLGCAILAQPQTASNLLDVLRATGDEVEAVGGDGLCCGAGYIVAGEPAGASACTARALEVIRSFKPERVVFECGSCRLFFAPLLAKMEPPPFKAQGVAEYLLEYGGRLPFKAPLNVRVAWHDPCHARWLKHYDPPRALLALIPGVKLVEMPRNRADAPCCGGLANTTRPEVTRALRLGRLEEARRAGADRLVTDCSNCVAAYAGLGILPVLNVANLLAEALGIRRSDPFMTILNSGDWDRAVEKAGANIRAAGLDPAEVRRLLPSYLERFRPKP
jgi:Fe-S oxidoreductase